VCLVHPPRVIQESQCPGSWRPWMTHCRCRSCRGENCNSCLLAGVKHQSKLIIYYTYTVYIYISTQKKKTYIYICVCIHIYITQYVVIYSQNSVWVESQGRTKRQVVVCFLCTTRALGGFSICSVGGPRSLIFPGSTTEELKNAEIWMWIQNSLNKVEGLGNLNENLLTHTRICICGYLHIQACI
jgi:hypothetical protein